jgi:hypothetical protein
MKRALIVIAAALLMSCMGNTIQHITIENGGMVVLENHEDGNTNDMRPDTVLTAPVGVP